MIYMVIIGNNKYEMTLKVKAYTMYSKAGNVNKMLLERFPDSRDWRLLERNITNEKYNYREV